MKKMKKITFLMLFAFVALVLNAQISRYIKVSATGAGNGTSWADAAGTADIQTQIDAVAADASQGTVYFAAGTYLIAAQIQLKNNVQLMGGYAADGSGTRDLLNNQTILDGQFNKRILYTGDQSPFVAFTKITKVDGFVLQRGSSSYGSAAAISIGTVLENCIIRNNNGSTYGAAVFIKRHATLANPTVGWNQGAALINCLVVNNSSSNYSAAIFVNQDTHFSVANCVIANNKSTDATNGVGGLYWGQNVRYSRISNSIFSNNIAPISTRNNIVFQNTSEIQLAIFNNYFSDAAYVDADITAANGNKNATDIASPGFAGATSFEGYDAAKMAEIADADWRLRSNSVLIGLGSNIAGKADIPYPYVISTFGGVARSFTTVTTDVMGSARIINSTVEMGSYEFNPIVVTVANSDAAKGTVSSSVTVSKGSSTSITANNTPPWVFSNWSDGSNTYTATQSGTNPNFTYTYAFVPTANVTMTASWEKGVWTGLENTNMNSYKIIGNSLVFDTPTTAEIINLQGKVMHKLNKETIVNFSHKGIYIIRYNNNNITKIIF